jgi:hypothetical protein
VETKLPGVETKPPGVETKPPGMETKLPGGLEEVQLTGLALMNRTRYVLAVGGR